MYYSFFCKIKKSCKKSIFFKKAKSGVVTRQNTVKILKNTEKIKKNKKSFGKGVDKTIVAWYTEQALEWGQTNKKY